MLESLYNDESTEWLQQTIISSKESVTPTVKQTKPRLAKQWITPTIRSLANKKINFKVISKKKNIGIKE